MPSTAHMFSYKCKKSSPFGKFLFLYIQKVTTSSTTIIELTLVTMIFKQTCPISLTLITLLLWLLHDSRFTLCITTYNLHSMAILRSPVSTHEMEQAHHFPSADILNMLSVVRLSICLCWYSRVNYEGPREWFRSGLAIWIGHMLRIYRKGWHV